MDKLNFKALDDLRDMLKKDDSNYIKVGMSTCGIAAGAGDVYNALLEETKKRNIDIKVTKCGCLGMCHLEPLVEVKMKGLPTVVYGSVDKAVALKILDKHVIEGRLMNDSIVDILKG